MIKRFNFNYNIKYLFSFYRFSSSTLYNNKNNIIYNQFLELKKKLNILELEQWKSITKQQIINNGGKKLLEYYNGSLFYLLNDIYPNEYWYGKIRVPKSYWESKENHKHFIKKFEEYNNIKSIKDWESIHYRSICNQGGKKLIEKYNNISNLLYHIYPNEDLSNFNPNKKPKGYWNDYNNQKKQFDELCKIFNIKDPKDWKNITTKHIKKEKQGSYMLSLYGGLIPMLKKFYPNNNWDPIQDRNRVPRNYWNNIDNRKQFILHLMKKLNIKELDDLHNLSWSIIRSNGGSRLLQYYKSNYDMLCTLFPEHNWDIFRLSQVSKNFWNDKSNHKLYLDYLYKKNNFKSLDDWNKITFRQFNKIGGGTLLRFYPSIIDMLQIHYPNHNWNIYKRKSLSRNYWKIKENHRLFLDYIKEELNILSQDQWKHISINDIIKLGGSSLYSYYPNLYEALKQNYPENNWDDVYSFCKIIPRNYFTCIDNQQQFLKDLQKKENLKSIQELVSIPLQTIKQYGGYSLLSLYNNNWIKVLETNYPEYKWDSLYLCKTPKYLWNDINYQRNVMNNIGKEIGIKHINDWNNISYKQITKYPGGYALLNRYNSLLELLQTLYPNNKWDIQLLSCVPRNYWNNKENIIKCINQVKKRFKIKSKQDWYRLSLKQFCEVKGGSIIIRRFNNLYNLLKYIYPNEEWNEQEFSKRDKRAGQRWLFLKLQELYKDYEILEDFFHDKLSESSSFPIQIDIYIPLKKLGFEYQGAHHYTDIPVFGHLDMQQMRDKKKEEICKENNIKLIKIPFWWDGEIHTLKQYISGTLNDNIKE